MGGDLEQVLQAGIVRVKLEGTTDVLRSQPSSKKKEKKESGEACGQTQRYGDAHVAGEKRSLSHASESSRARKAGKTNSKNSETARRKMPPIVSRSPILNAIARKKAQSYARSPNLHGRSPNSHGRSPNQAGTLKSPSLHDLSPC